MKKSKQKKKTPKEKPKEKELPEEVKPFDFGGIPARDLKKNLGCG